MRSAHMTMGGPTMFNQLKFKIMKVYVLIETDYVVGNDPKTIQLFLSHDVALNEMEKMYNEALKLFDTNEDDPCNALSLAEGFGDIKGGKYRINVIECELDLRSYIHDVQELTIVAEERGVREELMERGKSRSDVWELIQTWAEEYKELHHDEDYAANGTSFYDEIDLFVDEKRKELDMPYPEIERRTEDEDTDEILIVDKEFFRDEDEHCITVTARDGVARGDGIVVTYPKLADLTKEQIDEIEDYTGRIFDSGCITPWDVCIKFGKHCFVGIMDDTNGHNPDLVKQINVRWVQDKEMFKPILCALYERDIDEITDADSFMLDNWLSTPQYKRGKETGDWTEYNKLVLDIMRNDWDNCADNYLQHIADDQDLETILTFVRYDRSVNA